MLKIYTLGGLAIQRDDKAVTGFVSRKAEALLVYLVCERREHSRERLADLLWGNQPAERAMASLRVALSSLQQQVAEYLVVTRQTITFRVEAEWWLDANELDTGLDQIESQLATGERLRRSMAVRLAQTVGQYRGEFLAGFHLRDSLGFEEWQLLEQERLRGRILEALGRLVHYSSERKEYAAGIEYTTRLLQVDPLSEEAHRQLMILLARNGQRSAALAQYETCRRALEGELGVEPAEETSALLRQLEAGEIGLDESPPDTVSVLPIPPTPFVAREDELAQIAASLDNPDCRLLTLVGLGGIGKTRLALQAASDRLGDFRQGVFFVPLVSASADAPDALMMGIAGILDLAIQGAGDVADRLIGYLRDKEILLVIDNCEEYIAQAGVLSRILAKAPHLKILATSRERLNLHEEWILPIDGMDYPRVDGERSDQSGKVDSYGAVELFVQSVRRVVPHFPVAQNYPAIVRICQLVEGMPLGIELAATWARLVPCEQIAAQIERDLDSLATPLQNIPERHRSIRILFEESWRNLSTAEQNSLMKLSIFRGGFTTEAAIEAADASLPILLGLVEKSLVRSNGSGRYDMHELLRRSAHQKLPESGQLAATRTAHCKFFRAWVLKLPSPIQRVGDGSVQQRPAEYDNLREGSGWALDSAVEQRETEYDNLREALGWALDSKDAESLLTMAARLGPYWQRRGYFTEGRYWFKAGLAIAGKDTLSAWKGAALNFAGDLAWRQGDFAEARELFGQALEIHQTLKDEHGIATSLMHIAYLALKTGDYATSRSLPQEALMLARKQNDKFAESHILHSLGFISLELGDPNAAKTYLEASLALKREMGLLHNTTMTLINLGNVAVDQLDYELAARYYEEGLALAKAQHAKLPIALVLGNIGELRRRSGDLVQAGKLLRDSVLMLQEMGDQLNMICTLEYLAYIAINDEEPDRAVTILGAADAGRNQMGTPRTPRDDEDFREMISLVRAKMDESAFAAAWSEGQCMELPKLLGYVLERPLQEI